MLKNHESDSIRIHTTSLSTHNVDSFAKNIKVIDLDCNHYNILEVKNEIVGTYLLETLKGFSSPKE